MRKFLWTVLVSLPLLAGGLVYAKSFVAAGRKAPTSNEANYVCPITGEELPCPQCCPLNQRN